MAARWPDTDCLFASEGFRSLDDGSRVSYDAQPGDKGPKAINVQIL